MPPALSRLLLLCLPLGLAGSAVAVEFGSLRTLSHTGEPLLAEVDVRAEAGERLVDGCIRAHRPQVRRLPVLRDAALTFSAADDDGRQARLRIATGSAVTEPAVVLGLEASCGAGRVWREFSVLLAPPVTAAVPVAAASSVAGAVADDRPRDSDWVASPGESPQALAALLYPAQPGVQRRFLRALDAANPELGIADHPDRPLETGTRLHMPDWRRLASASGQGERRVPAAPSARLIVSTARDEVSQSSQFFSPRRPAARHSSAPELQLRLATTLAQTPEATEKMRQALRLEYRLLMALSEQLSASSMVPAAEVPPSVSVPEATRPEPVVPPPDTSVRPVVPAPAESAAPVSAAASSPGASTPEPAEPRPVSIPKAAPEPEPARGNDSDWLLYGGAAAAFVALAWLLLRRRRAVPIPVAFEHAPTMIMEHPQTAAAAPSAEAMEAFFAEPAVAPVRPPAPVAMPPVAEKTEVNPVMELAEIMLSFGRLQGAAQTLQEYIEANPREALQPWVKLLEIYRSGEMRAEFESLAQKLNSNFNVEVLHWDEQPRAVAAEEIPAKALSLEEMPHIREQLQVLWGKPECLGYLQQLLHDNRGGQRTGFSLPVVQEILLLIDVLMTREAMA